jgi:hypothetical protein
VHVNVDGAGEQERVAEINSASRLTELDDAAVVDRQPGPARRATWIKDATRDLLVR